MKSAMPFLGVGVPVARRVTRAQAKAARIAEGAVLRQAARHLWDEAEYREERYAAMALLAVASASVDAAVVTLVEHMVRTGRWWDYTDELAHRLAERHDLDPEATRALVLRWSTDEDMWIRRIAIISQLGRKVRVDRDLLAAVISTNLGDREFFIRKAIGWALRKYARVDPEWVADYADTHDLSPLSRREALKHL